MKPRTLKTARLSLLLGMALWHGPLKALAIDTMVLISGQNPKGDHLTLKNDSETPVFVKTELSSLTMTDNQASETLFTKDNLMQWGMTLDPGLFILDPGEARQVALKPLTSPDRARDEVYGVAFVPQPTLPDQGKGEQMNIQVGFKAYYIVPARVSKMDYRVSYDHQSGRLTLANRGNSLLLARLDRCRAGAKEDPKKPCATSFLAIAGKEKVYTVPAWLRGEEMAFEILNHDKRYRQPLVLTRQQPTQQGGNRG